MPDRIVVNMGNVWDRATEFLSDNLSAIVPIALLAMLLPIGIVGSIRPIAAASPDAAPIVNLFIIGLSIVVLWGGLAVTALALDPAIGRGPAIRAANRRIAASIGFVLVLFVAFAVVVFLPVAIGLALSGFDMEAAARSSEVEIPASAAGLIALYVVVLMPLLIWASARLALLWPVVIHERRGMKAIQRSFVLTRGIGTKIVGVILLYGIVFGVAYLAAKFVFGAIFGLMLGGDDVVSTATVLSAIFVAVVQTVFVVLAAAFVAKLYLAVRDAREAIVDSA